MTSLKKTEACFLALLVVASISSCSSREEGGTPRASDSSDWLKKIPVEEACDHLLEPDESSDLGVRTVHTQIGLDLFAKAGIGLSSNPGDKNFTACWFSVDAKLRKEVEVKFSWAGREQDLQGIGDGVRIGSDSLAQRSPGSSGMTMWTRCQVGTPKKEGEEDRFPSLVVGKLNDKAGFSDASRLKLLVKATGRVTAHMRCRNDPVFPEPSDIDALARK